MSSSDDVDVCIPNYKYLFHEGLLRGKVAFVTGGGSGIGFTITEILMRHGCDVVIASRNLQRLQRSANKLEVATGRKCLPVKLDVRKPADVISAVDSALQHYGKIDILVNNAAGNFAVPVTGMSFNAFKTVMEIDTMGVFNVSKTVYEKYMQKHGGIILNISATLHYRGNIMQTHAAAAKAGIDSMTKSLAVEWGDAGVRVVGLAPGPIADTEGYRKLSNQAMRDHLAKMIAIGRVGTKVEMAHAALFLVSDAASYVTGETLVADGGQWLTTPNSMALSLIGNFGSNKPGLRQSQSKL